MIFAAQQRSGALNEENLIEAARVNEVNLAHRCHTDKQQQFFGLDCQLKIAFEKHYTITQLRPEIKFDLWP